MIYHDFPLPLFFLITILLDTLYQLHIQSHVFYEFALIQS